MIVGYFSAVNALVILPLHLNYSARQHVENSFANENDLYEF